MCPAAPPTDIGVYASDEEGEISFESPLAGIGVYSSDEEVVMTLERILRGCPLPANVISEVNPYNVIPWDLPDGIWYFFSMEDPKATETGYWKATGEHHKIFTNSSITGSRLSLEFYLGQAPHGIKTDWMMHDFRINQKQLLETDKAKDSHSLSRVFLNYSQGSNTEEQQRNKAKAIRNKLNIEKDDPRYSNSIQDLDELCDISNGDFLELLDLDNSESSSSSAINSRRLSFSSDEYFDPEAILRALDSGNDQDPEHKFTDGKLSVSAPTRVVQVVIRPESLGNGSHVQDSSPSLIAANESVTDLSLQASTSKEAKPTSMESKVGTTRMQKLRKKYWCFKSL